jgi:hypothetical protein
MYFEELVTSFEGNGRVQYVITNRGRQNKVEKRGGTRSSRFDGIGLSVGRSLFSGAIGRLPARL